MANTFDTSRVGGGTYELAKDANGNYNLKSVGFTQVNKLNLPDLKSSAATTDVAKTTKDATEATIKAQTTEVFTPTNTYGGGDGQQNTSTPMLKNAEVNEASVRNAGDAMTKIDTGKTTGKFLASGAAGSASLRGEKQSDGFLTSGAAGNTAPYKDGILNNQTGVKYSKPPSIKSRATSAVQNTVSGVIDSVKNNKAIQIASTALGFITNPIMGGVKMVAGTLQESPQDKFNKGYFNLNPAESGGRISGNPANNVFAGMNAVSAFGNVRSGALNRVDKRNKTSEKLSGAKKENFDAKTKEFQNQVNEYDQSRADKKDAESGNTKTNVTGFGKSGFGRDTSQGGGDTGGGGGRVICTDLHKTGELSTIDWIRDTKFTFKKLTKTHVKGYLLWAEPTVKHIQKYPKYRKMWKHIAQHRANDIAWRLNEGKFDLLGRIYAGIGEPVCWALGNFVSDKQISKYNLTHWRRA